MKQTITETTTLNRDDIIDLILHSFKDGTKITKGLKSIPESLTLQNKTVIEETKETKETKEDSQSYWQDSKILHKEADAVQAKLNADFCEACERGDVKAVQDLLSKGADIHHLNYFGLRLACKNGYDDVVRELLKSGADANAYDVLWLAVNNGHTEVVRLLIAYGADVNKQSAEELLDCADGHGHTEIFDVLERWIEDQ